MNVQSIHTVRALVKSLQYFYDDLQQKKAPTVNYYP